LSEPRILLIAARDVKRLEGKALAMFFLEATQALPGDVPCMVGVGGTCCRDGKPLSA